MRVLSIDTGFFKLDGGAMFGIVPRRLWEKLNPPDENNLCTWAMRCLLIETGERRILVDTGIGDKFDDKFRSHFEPSDDANLFDSLARHGCAPEDVTDVLLTHLHFDHAGGATLRDEQGRLLPAFPNARYWTNQRHYRWACRPNAREAASFLPENFRPLEEAGVLHFIPDAEEDQEWLPGIRLRFCDGHTEAMMIPIIETNGKTIVYCADLIPSTYHLGLPYVMAYDVRPLRTLEEKQRLLREAHDGGYYLFFEHDPSIACATVDLDERGRFRLGQMANMDSW